MRTSPGCVSTLYLLVLGLMVGDSICTRIIGTAVPEVTDVDQPAKLECAYDISQQSLYSVKWYKNTREFFRYMPHYQPTYQVFPVPEFTVYTQNNCNQSHCGVTLTQLSPEASGAYSCELSEGAPAYATVVETKNMTVAVLPLVPPTVKGLKTSYSVGEMLDVTCSSAPTSINSDLVVTLNRQRIDDKHTIRRTDPTTINKVTISLRVRLTINREHFGAGEVLTFSCKATIPGTNMESHPSEGVAHLMYPQPLREPNLVQSNESESSRGIPLRPHHLPLLMVLRYLWWQRTVH